MVALLAVAAIVVATTRAQEPGAQKHPEEKGPFASTGPHQRIEKGFRFNFDGGGAWLGVTLSDISEEKAKELKLSGDYGVQVKEVSEDSPAAKAGLAKDDIIVEFAGEKVRSAMQLRRLVRETPPGRDVTIVVRRGAETKKLTAKLGEPKDRTRGFFEAPMPPGTFNIRVPHPLPEVHVPDFDFVWMRRGARLGISGDELTSQLAQYFGVKQGKGILVREVVVGSAAEKAGLKAGDVIVAVDGKEVSTVRELRRTLDGSADQKENRKLALTIVRDKQEQTVSVELDPAQRLGPREMAWVEPGIDPEELAEITADAQEQAREYAEQARELEEQQEFQDQQEELMQRLREELPRDLEKEIRREVQDLRIQTGVV
jgi:membrane-associated protease RseP (regulator of RpoE activity)